MSKERPPASKNVRSFQTAEKGDLESACPWGAEIGPTPKADLECGRYVAAFFPRRHVASFQSADMSAHSKRSARRLAQKLLVRPARAEGDPHGRPLPTCDLVEATSLLVSVLLPHNVNSFGIGLALNFYTLWALLNLAVPKTVRAFQQSEISSSYRLGAAQGLTPSATDAAGNTPTPRATPSLGGLSSLFSRRL